MNISIDQTMLIQDLYAVRALIADEELEQAKTKLQEIIALVSYSPTAEKKASFPRTRTTH